VTHLSTVVGGLLLLGAVAGRPRRLVRAADRPPGGTHRRSSPRRVPIAARRRSQPAIAEADVLRGLPELLDLLAVAVAAGLPAASAVAAVARRSPEPWRPAFDSVEHAVARGARLVDGLDRLVEHHGDLARPLVAALGAALDDGDSLGPALARLAVDARDLRRRRAEEAARRLPVRLLLPLVACSLPAFAVLTVVPILAGALSGIRLPR
jgi:tight adherence protein C